MTSYSQPQEACNRVLGKEPFGPKPKATKPQDPVLPCGAGPTWGRLRAFSVIEAYRAHIPKIRGFRLPEASL